MDDLNMNLRNSCDFLTPRIGVRIICLLAVLLACVAAPADSVAQTASWIWSPKAGDVSGVTPQGSCYFRTKFTLIKPEKAEIIFAAGDEFELYLNNRLVSKGESFGSESKVDVFPYVQPGVNLVAVKVTHVGSDQPGLAMKIRVKEKNETRWRSLVSNNTWKTRQQEMTAWKQNSYNDMGWLKAQILSDAVALGRPAGNRSSAVVATAPAKPPASSPKPDVVVAAETPVVSAPIPVKQVKVTKDVIAARSLVPDTKPQEPTTTPASAPVAAATVTPPTPEVSPAVEAIAADESASPPASRFTLDPEFSIQQVLSSKEAGPMVAMAFDEFGKVVFSRENGPLMIADLSLPTGAPNRVRVYCDKVTNCGGILPVNGSVYVTGDGPAGLALYKLSITDRSKVLQPAKALFKFSGTSGPHGPHSMRLGPDGMIYMVLGNGSKVDRPLAKTSPYQHVYEGDVVGRMEDPAGHAAGVDAPGGTIVRCSLDGSTIETFAGGLRNANDLVFDANGQLFVHDSDNPADMGTPWYRPSMLFHVAAGSELGWRRGSSKFASHFVDATQPVCETGSGMPSGVVAYRHLQFPARFHDVLFTSNRTTGEVLSLQPQRAGASYSGSTEPFLRGKNFDIADLAVGEDGALYIATGSHAGVGGLYRVSWSGDVPQDLLKFESDLAKVIRHPQPDSSWARQNVAQLKITMGGEWNNAIRGVANETRNPTGFRIRALQLMVLYGPAIDTGMLRALASEQDPQLRAQVAQMCGVSGDSRIQQVLRELLSDADPMVRCSAAEAMLKLDIQPEFSILAKLLKSEDRVEAAVARRLLSRLPVKGWKEDVLTTDDKRLFIQGAVTLSIVQPTIESSYAILARASQFMDGFVSDDDFTDMLRAMQLALVQSKVDPGQIPGFVKRIGNEFPSGNAVMNLELARLLGYLKVGDLDGRIESYFNDDEVKPADKLAVAMQLQAGSGSLNPGELLSLLKLLEAARRSTNVGDSYAGYLNGVLTKCSQSVSADHVATILAEPQAFTASLIPAFYHVPEKLDDDVYEQLVKVDKAFAGKADQQSREIRLGVVALMGQSGDEASMRYLRKLWQTETDRRSDIVIGLAQQPDGENWSYLVSSLPVLDQSSAKEILDRLKTVPRKPRDSRHFRELIQIAEKMDNAASQSALSLMEHWAGTSLGNGSRDRDQLIASWKQWCDQQFKTAPAASTAAGGNTDRF